MDILKHIHHLVKWFLPMTSIHYLGPFNKTLYLNLNGWCLTNYKQNKKNQENPRFFYLLFSKIFTIKCASTKKLSPLLLVLLKYIFCYERNYLKCVHSTIKCRQNKYLWIFKMKTTWDPGSKGYHCFMPMIQFSLLTKSTSHIIKVPSLEPEANFVPSGEKRQNHTSSQWSCKICVVKHGNWSLQIQKKDYHISCEA